MGRTLSILGLLALAACSDSCRPRQHPVHVVFDAPNVVDGEGISMATQVRVVRDREAGPRAASRDAHGRVHYFFETEEGWSSEVVVEGSLEGSLALAHNTFGEALIAAVLPPGAGPAPSLPALAESIPGEIEGEGELVLFHRRGPGLWRSRKIAAGALCPSLAIGAEGEIHLAFLQPSLGGRFAVVYAQIKGTALLREEAGRGAMEVTPSLMLVEEKPVVTYAADLSGPTIVQTRGREGFSFDEPRVFPQGILGGPPLSPRVLAWKSEGDRELLFFSGTVFASELSLPGNGKRAALDPEAREAVMLARLYREEIESLEVLFTTDGAASGTTLLFDDAPEIAEVVSVAGGLPLERSSWIRSNGSKSGARRSLPGNYAESPRVILLGSVDGP